MNLNAMQNQKRLSNRNIFPFNLSNFYENIFTLKIYRIFSRFDVVITLLEVQNKTKSIKYVEYSKWLMRSQHVDCSRTSMGNISLLHFMPRLVDSVCTSWTVDESDMLSHGASTYYSTLW